MSNLRIDASRLTKSRRFARNAARNIMRRRTTIGVAGLIRVTMVGKCGGAVVKLIKKHRDASFQSMRARKMMKMMQIQMISFKIS